MQKYIALLRGVNVGGKNKLPMDRLKAALTAAGFADVSTYIQSGNVFFASDEAEPETLQQRISAVIHADFELTVPVCVLSSQELNEAVGRAPEWWGRDEAATHNAIFVIAPATVEDIYAEVGQMKPEYENAAHHGRVILWSAPVATFSRTRLSRVVGTKVYDSITIRNANTTRKLCELTKLH
jgi:uncharacterized protein (DUF1697 family)